MDSINLIRKKGLAVDIDGTLSFTFWYWLRKMQAKFHKTEKLSVEDLIEKYRHIQNESCWQNIKALNWIKEKINTNKLQSFLPIIKQSSLYLNKIDKITPINAYITIRPEKLRPGTERWLKKHNFPLAPLICRPNNINSSNGLSWKSKILKILYPKVVGIIDDNAKLLKYLNPNYQGRVFLYNHLTNFNFPFAIACNNWHHTYFQIKKYYFKK